VVCMKINEKTGLYDNYGLWHVPFWQTDTFYMIVKMSGCLVGLVAIILLYKAYKNYQKRKKAPAWVIALQELNQLEKEHKVNVGHGKEFYGTVTTLLKRYLHQRFGYDLIGKTDDEVLHYLAKSHSDLLLVEDVKTIFMGSVVIKFANADAAQDQIDHDYRLAALIVNQTIPKEKNKSR
jgi:hypothetical protein